MPKLCLQHVISDNLKVVRYWYLNKSYSCEFSSSYQKSTERINTDLCRLQVFIQTTGTRKHKPSMHFLVLSTCSYSLKRISYIFNKQSPAAGFGFWICYIAWQICTGKEYAHISLWFKSWMLITRRGTVCRKMSNVYSVRVWVKYDRDIIFT